MNELIIFVLFLLLLCLYFVVKTIYLESKINDLKEERDAYKTISQTYEQNERKKMGK